MLKRWVAVMKTTVFLSIIVLLTIYCNSYAQSKSAAPRNLKASSKGGNVTLTWEAPQSGTPAKYNIYKASYSGRANNPGMTADMPSLHFMKIASTKSTKFTVKGSAMHSTAASVTYYVTAVSKSGKESPPSNQVHIAANKSGKSSKSGY